MAQMERELAKGLEAMKIDSDKIGRFTHMIFLFVERPW